MFLVEEILQTKLQKKKKKNGYYRFEYTDMT